MSIQSIQQISDEGINTLEELHDALRLAMQLEFSTIPPYLCAQWSIDHDPSGIDLLIRGVVIEEMHHFGLAGNILYAINGTVDLLDPNFLPTYPTNLLPGGIVQKKTVDTLPLSKEQVQVFMQIEQPEFTPVGTRGLQTFATIGAFYKVIRAALEKLNPPINLDAKQMPVFKAISDDKNGKITSLEDAKAAIELILEEGEGTEGNPEQPPDSAGARDELAHYYSFREILEGNKLTKQSGAWAYDGDPLVFPSVHAFSGKVADLDFMACFKELMGVLQACWTEDPKKYDHSKYVMGKMEGLGRALVKAGKYPIFQYA